MDNPLSRFLDEYKSSNILDKTETDRHEFDDDDDNKEDESIVLIAGSVDWDMMTSKTPMGLDSPKLINFSKPVKAVYSSANSFHLFFKLDDESIFSLGRNNSGQLGTGDNLTRTNPSLINIKMDSKIVKISTGKAHSIILCENGDLLGSGSNDMGQLGLGSKNLDNLLKFEKLNMKNVKDVSCGQDFTILCTNSGSLYSCGHPEYGQLGLGTNGEYIKEASKGIQYSHVYTFTQINKFISKDSKNKIINESNSKDLIVLKVSAGKNHAMCLCQSNDIELKLYSWGFGGYGRLGHNSVNDEYFPRELSFFSNSISNKQKEVSL